MGLDMRLYKKHYVKNWEHMRPEELHHVTVTKNGQPTAIKPERVAYITEEVAIWRKANAIHKWFADRKYYDNYDAMNGVEVWVSREELKELLDTVTKVLDASKLVKGQVKNGERYDPDTKSYTPVMEDGEYIEDPTVAKDLLPTESGFFFGSTDYDHWYYHDLEYTQQVLTEALAEPDEGDFYYEGDW